ncbi:hypothetical protein ACJX0J_006087, partial [Zea mays]
MPNNHHQDHPQHELRFHVREQHASLFTKIKNKTLSLSWLKISSKDRECHVVRTGYIYAHITNEKEYFGMEGVRVNIVASTSSTEGNNNKKYNEEELWVTEAPLPYIQTLYRNYRIVWSLNIILLLTISNEEKEMVKNPVCGHLDTGENTYSIGDAINFLAMAVVAVVVCLNMGNGGATCPRFAHRGQITLSRMSIYLFIVHLFKGKISLNHSTWTSRMCYQGLVVACVEKMEGAYQICYSQGGLSYLSIILFFFPSFSLDFLSTKLSSIEINL